MKHAPILSLPLSAALSAALLLGCAGPRAVSTPALSLAPVPQVTPDSIRPRVEAGSALLVCAFSAEDYCYRNVLPRAVTLAELRGRAARLPRSTELVFYCACDGDSTAHRVAARFRSRGWTNVKVLEGGPAAWRGLPDLL